ncbi:MAG TPA: transglycosylase SLT domain-containing protein [Candidatus Acidoferrales bacterium]|nr:transglycosylase SLT domain-containing protein [Candidatus Acidoferrales bacterium]
MFCLSRLDVRLRAISFAVAGGVLGLLIALPSQAQIASYVDGHGTLIYTNANPPARRDGHTANAENTAVITTPPAKLEKVVRAAAAKNGLDPALVQAVIQAESNWNPRATSRKGAFGLMQLIPKTAERYGVEDVFDPVQNIQGGTRYLRDLLDRFNGDLKKSLAAYNAGEQAVERFGGVPAFRETRDYVRKVTNTYFQSGPEHSPTGEARRIQIREMTNREGRTVFTNE